MELWLCRRRAEKNQLEVIPWALAQGVVISISALKKFSALFHEENFFEEIELLLIAMLVSPNEMRTRF